MKMRFQDFGKGSPLRNDLKSWRAALGLNNGTSCPAPLTVAKVSPSYTSVQPPTFIKNHKTFHIILHRDFDKSDLSILLFIFNYISMRWNWPGFWHTMDTMELLFLISAVKWNILSPLQAPLSPHLHWKSFPTNFIIGRLIKCLKEMEDTFLARSAWFIDRYNIT